jgi:hypothetical protein
MPGIVIHSHLKKGKSGSSVGHGTGPQSTVYRPQVIYSYEVQGRRFGGKRLRLGSEPHTCRKSLVKENVARYPEGASVTVHYDLRNHPNPCWSRASQGSGIAGSFFRWRWWRLAQFFGVCRWR